MTNQEQQLIDAIKAKPGYQVFPGSAGGAVRIVRTSKSSIGQQSVWLGRRSTIEQLQQILARAA